MTAEEEARRLTAEVELLTAHLTALNQAATEFATKANALAHKLGNIEGRAAALRLRMLKDEEET
jgi:hypothetical protein